MLTVSFNISVAPLPEDDVWFANSQAWTNYWRDVGGVANIDPITTTVYTPSAYDETKLPVNIEIDGVPHQLATSDMLQTVKDKLDHLDTAFQLMRNQMKNAGLITEAQ